MILYLNLTAILKQYKPNDTNKECGEMQQKSVYLSVYKKIPLFCLLSLLIIAFSIKPGMCKNSAHSTNDKQNIQLLTPAEKQRFKRERSSHYFYFKRAPARYMQQKGLTSKTQNIPAYLQIEFMKALRLTNQRKWQEAIQAFQAIIDEAPDSKIAKDSQQMLNDIKRFAKKESRRSKADTLQDLKRPDKPILSQPNQEFLKGLDCIKQKKWEEAIETFSSIIKNYPDSEAAKRSQEIVKRIRNLKDKKPSKRAIKKPAPIVTRIPAKPAKKDSFHPPSEFLKAQTYIMQKKWDEAIKTLQAIIDNCPGSKIAEKAQKTIWNIERYGKKQTIKKRDTTPTKALEQSREQMKQKDLFSAQIEFVKGMKHANRGDYKKASRIFQSIINEFPNSKYSKYSQKMLKKIRKLNNQRKKTGAER